MPTDPEARKLIDLLTTKVTTQGATIDAQAKTIATQQAAIASQQAAITEIKADVIELQTPDSPPPPDIPPPPPPNNPPPVVGSYPTPTATVNKLITVKVGDNLQAALAQAAIDSASANVEVRVQPGKYLANFQTKMNPGAKGLVTVRADVADGTLAPTSKPWITPEYLPGMVQLASPNTAWNLTTDDAVGNVRFFGVAFPPNLANSGNDLAYIGRGDMTALAQMPYRWEFDSCYFFGDPAKGQHRGLQLNVAYGVVRRSYFDDFLEFGRDCQAFAAFAGPGPYLIEDTRMEASHENLIFGGSDPKIVGMIPSDIVIRRCHFFKDPAWKAKYPMGSYMVKNLGELKSARRVKIEYCLFENNWPDGQSGDAFLGTSRNQDGGAPWSEISDVEIGYCVIKNVDGFAFELLGNDYRMPSARGKNFSIHDILTINVKGGVTSNDGFRPTSIKHCTFANITDKFLQFSGPVMPAGTFAFEANVTGSGLYAIAGEGTTVGKPSLDAYAPGASMKKNVIEQPAGWGLTGLTGDTLIPNGSLAGRFDARKRYTGTETDEAGVKVGADVDKIIAGMPWATW